MDNKTKTIIIENEKRRAVLNRPYDPIVGIGSPLERKELIINDLGVFYLPLSFFDTDFGYVLENSRSIGKLMENVSGIKSYDDGVNEFIKERIKYDFEFWCAYAVKIKPKKEDNSEEDKQHIISFVLNQPQRRLLGKLEKLRLKGKPIRIILLKARQWGGSTLVQIYIAWYQLIILQGFNSIICTEVENQASNIRGMYSRMVRHYPENLGTIKLSNFESSSKNKYIADRDCVLSIGSAEKPNTIRSQDVRAAHLSEIGLWPKTLTKSPEDLIQSLEGTIPETADSLIVKESTAKGEGNYFHTEWLKSIAGNSGYDPIFVSWFEIEKYQKSIEDYTQFISSMSLYEIELWDLGATLEAINWYNSKTKKFNDLWRMKSEFPSTAEEAFQSSGRKFFRMDEIKKLSKTCIDPIFIGNVFSDSLKGKKAFENINFKEENKGNLHIWTMPEPIITINNRQYEVKNRYCSFVDIGGKTEKADFSTIKILDRYWMLEGGVPEVAAVWSGHLDQDLFAWEAAKICYAYGIALMAIEYNSLRIEETEGDHYETVLNEIKNFYPNLFIRNVVDSINKDYLPKYGFFTGTKSKTMILDALVEAMRVGGYIERDIRTINELKWFEIKPNGKLGAIEGKNDDLVIVTAGSVWLSNKYIRLPAPKLIELIPEGQKRKGYGKSIISEASL